MANAPQGGKQAPADEPQAVSAADKAPVAPTPAATIASMPSAVGVERRVKVRVAHHMEIDEDGMPIPSTRNAPAGKHVLPGDEIVVTETVARALAASGRLVGVDPADPATVEQVISDGLQK